MRVKTAKRSRRGRFIRSWQTYSVGNEIEPNGALRDWLIGCGYCEPIAEETSEPETEFAVAPPVAETTATRSSRKQRKHNRQHAVRT